MIPDRAAFATIADQARLNKDRQVGRKCVLPDVKLIGNLACDQAGFARFDKQAKHIKPGWLAERGESGKGFFLIHISGNIEMIVTRQGVRSVSVVALKKDAKRCVAVRLDRPFGRDVRRQIDIERNRSTPCATDCDIGINVL